ncbi:hypothetical protein IQ218_12235 [Synechocystis salina LEGE 06099]|nr:hypothetical protein [Synechocystis salina LEGE 06099]
MESFTVAITSKAFITFPLTTKSIQAIADFKPWVVTVIYPSLPRLTNSHYCFLAGLSSIA